MNLFSTPGLVCPLYDCTWTLPADDHDTTTYLVKELSEAEITDAIHRVCQARAQNTQDTMREHLREHDPLDLYRAIRLLQMELAQHDHGIRPHVRTTEVVIHRPADPDPELTGTLRQFWGDADRG